MNRKFLESLGVDDSLIDKILDKHAEDVNDSRSLRKKLAEKETDLAAAREQGDEEIARLKKDLESLQAKYEHDKADLTAQLAARDYSDAVRQAISESGVKFTSRAAERAFTAGVTEAKLPLKDGALDGFTAYLDGQRKSDPGAFQSETATPRIVLPVGGGAADSGTPKKNEQPDVKRSLAESLGKTEAETMGRAMEIINMYTGQGGNK